jgi:2-octaprenyl-6-methoxyphenol hydroxylase
MYRDAVARMSEATSGIPHNAPLMRATIMEKDIADHSFEAVVVGGGPIGLTTAIALASCGLSTALVSKRQATPDYRTTALLHGSVAALAALGIWDACIRHAAPLRVIRVVDDTARLLRAPEVSFSAEEIGLEAFGQNVENRYLLAALEARVKNMPALTWLEGQADKVQFSPESASVVLKSGAQLTGKLLVGADGRGSLCREQAGLPLQIWNPSPQHALTLNFLHGRPHHDTSIEFHTEMGPFTLVPLPGQRSSLVHVMNDVEAQRISALSDQELGEEIEGRSHSILGKIEVEPGRGFFPLGTGTADAFSAPRLVLVGEAAHVLPPIGAQGLNLGLRDAATVAELAADAHRASTDIGGHELTERYDQMRRADIMSRTAAVDLLNRSLLSDSLPFQATRGLGLFLMQQIAPLRRAAMREGVMPAASAPRLMLGVPL